METPTPLKRITMRSILEDALDIFNLERGLIYTAVVLTTRPGEAIRTYLYEDRTKLVKPFRFLLLTIAVATFLTLEYFKVSNDVTELQSGFVDGFALGSDAAKDGMDNAEAREKAQVMAKQAGEIFKNYFNISLLLGVPVLAFATGLTFRRKMNYAENLVINSYVTGYLTLAYILIMPLLWLMSYVAMSQVFVVIMFGYSIWAYTKVYQEKLGAGIGKSITAILIYLLVYYLLIVIAAIAVLLLLKS